MGVWWCLGTFEFSYGVLEKLASVFAGWVPGEGTEEQVQRGACLNYSL